MRERRDAFHGFQRRREPRRVGRVLLLVGLALPACLAPEPTAPRRQSVATPFVQPRLRLPNRWFMRQRLSAGGAIPVGARTRALAALERGGPSRAVPGTWVNVGPRNVGGRVTALALDPNDPNHIWLGAAEGGVWSSTDGGETWTPVFDDQGVLSIGSLAAHPTDSAILYVGTGEDNGGGYSYDGEGVFKTTDGGQTWTNLGLAEVKRIGRIAVDPVNPQRVFVAAGGDWFVKNEHRGVYRSTDGGQTWEKVLFVADDSGAIDIAIDPSNPQRIFAAIWQRFSFGSDWYVGGPNSGIWRSLDGGDTWTRLSGGLPSGDNVGRIGIAIAPSNPDIVYAIVFDDPGFLIGVYRSLDGGDTWVKRNSNIFPFLLSGFSYYFGNIRVHPVNQNQVYVLDLNLYRSNDGGVNFSNISSGVHVDHHALIVEASGRLLDGNDGGFYWSLDDGGSWTKSLTLPITQFYDIGIDTLDPNRRFGGAQDNGTNRTTSGSADDWENVLGGDGMQCEVDYTDSMKVYAESQYGNIARSTDGGDTFTGATDGIDPTERANWVTPITLDPLVPTTLYTGFQRVYRSTNAAESWEPISPDLTNGPGDGLDVSDDPEWRERQDHLENLITGTITAVSVSPVDTDIIWAGTDDGNVWVTSDGGLNWTQVNPPGLAFWVTDIAPDPFDAQTAYLTVTGYREGDRMPYIRVTRDLGLTWEDITSDLPQVPLNAVLADPQWEGQLFVASDLGVHLSDDGGASWRLMDGGIPVVVVLDLWLHGTTRTLYAATHGRSIYAFDLDQLPPPDRDGDGVVNVNDCAPDDPGAWAPPEEVEPLSVDKGAANESLLSWPSLSDQAGPGTVYDLAVGDVSDLTPSGGTGGSRDLACGVAETQYTDPAIPPTGDGFYYLVRGRNACAAGTWGQDSGGLERSSPACP